MTSDLWQSIYMLPHHGAARGRVSSPPMYFLPPTYVPPPTYFLPTYYVLTIEGSERESCVLLCTYFLPTSNFLLTVFLPTYYVRTMEGSERESCVLLCTYHVLTMHVPWRVVRARVASPSDEAPSRAAARRNIATRAAAEMAPRLGVGVGVGVG